MQLLLSSKSLKATFSNFTFMRKQSRRLRHVIDWYCDFISSFDALHDFREGCWLVSGYNTLPPEEKAKFNGQVLSKWVGYTLMMPITVLIGSIGYLQATVFFIPIIVIAAVYIVAMVVFMNIKGIGRTD